LGQLWRVGQPGAGGRLRLLMELGQVALVDDAGGQRVGQQLLLELVHLGQRQVGRLHRRAERLVELHEGREEQVDDQSGDPDVDEYPQQAVDAADDRHAVDRGPDHAPDVAGDHGDDQRQEDRQDGVGVQVVRHGGGVGVAVGDDHQDGGQEEDLDQQRLDDPPLVANYERDQQHDADRDVYEQARGNSKVVSAQ